MPMSNIRSKHKSTLVLYTDGTEYRLTSTGIPYIGLYHNYKNGMFSGVSHDKNSVKLFNIEVGPESVTFKRLNTKFKKPLQPIKQYKPQPTDSDYAATYIIRYFIKNTHDGIIIEVDVDTYSNYSKIDTLVKNIYRPIEIEWKISGPEKDVVVDSYIVETGIIDTNNRTLDKLDMPEIKAILPLMDLAKITS